MRSRTLPARTFSAALHPDGDPQWDVPGPLVRLDERGPDGGGGQELKRVRWLTPGEAAALAGVLTTAAAGTPCSATPREVE